MLIYAWKNLYSNMQQCFLNHDLSALSILEKLVSPQSGATFGRQKRRVGSLGGLRGQSRIENKCIAVQEHVYLPMLSL